MKEVAENSSDGGEGGSAVNPHQIAIQIIKNN